MKRIRIFDFEDKWIIQNIKIDVLITDIQELNTMLKQLNESSKRISLSKNKMMSSKYNNTIDDVTIENKDNYIYLTHKIEWGNENQSVDI